MVGMDHLGVATPNFTTVRQKMLEQVSKPILFRFFQNFVKTLAQSIAIWYIEKGVVTIVLEIA